MRARRGAGTLEGPSILGLLGWIAITAGAASIGGMAAANSREFYASLQRPEWAPPGSVFGPVWTVLYLTMAVAAWLVWRARSYVGARVAIGLFLVQLCLNILWTWLFFAWHQGALALADIVLLWVAVAMTINMFWRVRALAGALLVPYLAWVSFATALTYAVWKGNPGIL
ncbi:MAG: TspO and like protein [Gemmatimonadetes bacterium]|jgi:tryptophan-rich sensory protein|nr:TspO and like protein [Gemmatimonadota bacterium]